MTQSQPGTAEAPLLASDPGTSRKSRRHSFSELGGRQRAFALVDRGSGRELCGAFDDVESPWLERQDIVPQADDGVVVVKGAVSGASAVVVSIEQAFQGGAVGEVSGAKISAALALATADSRNGTPTAAVLILESGGVRLQEANLGLAAVAEICAEIVALRALRPVVGLIAGPLGCFGGLSIAAGLCSRLVMTRGARLGLNGPEVIESEAGLAELDSTDRPTIWDIDGGSTRVAIGHADELVVDDIDAMRTAVRQAVGSTATDEFRSRRLAATRRRLDAVDPSSRPSSAELRAAWGEFLP